MTYLHAIHTRTLLILVLLSACVPAASGQQAEQQAGAEDPLVGAWTAPGNIVITISRLGETYKGVIADPGPAKEFLDVGQEVLRFQHREGQTYEGEYLRVASSGQRLWQPCTLTLPDTEELRASYGVTYRKQEDES